jgi:hypothetical protein
MPMDGNNITLSRTNEHTFAVLQLKQRSNSAARVGFARCHELFPVLHWNGWKHWLVGSLQKIETGENPVGDENIACAWIRWCNSHGQPRAHSWPRACT